MSNRMPSPMKSCSWRQDNPGPALAKPPAHPGASYDRLTLSTCQKAKQRW